MDPGAGREQIQLQEVPGYSRHGPVEVQALRSSRRTKELDRGPLVVEGGGGGSWAKVDEPGRTGAAGLRKVPVRGPLPLSALLNQSCAGECHASREHENPIQASTLSQ
jgi:hypothetical protein